MVGLPTEGIVFLLTDTMNSRKTIAEMLLQKQEVELLIETRMGLDEGQIYTTIPQHEDEVTQYLETLNYTDEQASTSVCGISQSVVTTAVIVASMAVRQAIKFINADEFSRQLHIGIGLDSIVGL